MMGETQPPTEGARAPRSRRPTAGPPLGPRDARLPASCAPGREWTHVRSFKPRVVVTRHGSSRTPTRHFIYPANPDVAGVGRSCCRWGSRGPELGLVPVVEEGGAPVQKWLLWEAKTKSPLTVPLWTSCRAALGPGNLALTGSEVEGVSRGPVTQRS